MNLIITGAHGFVGQHLLPYLSDKGHSTVGLNLRDKDKVKNLVLPEGDAVIHLAGKAHDLKGASEQEEYFYVNLELTQKVFDRFLESKAKIFIHFSTVAAVADGTVNGVLYENTPARPETPYGISKYQAEQYLLSKKLTQDKKLYIIRPAMIHGPGDKGNLTLLYKVIAKGIPYPLGAFNNERSFLGIENLCFGIGQILGNADKVPSGIYNLVDDEPTGTLNLIDLIASVLAKKKRIWTIPRPLVNFMAKIGDVLQLPLNTKRLTKLTENYVVSNEKIKNALGIAALPVSAEEGLRRTIKSFVKQKRD